jgi:lysophospholipase L1-like esterase
MNITLAFRFPAPKMTFLRLFASAQRNDSTNQVQRSHHWFGWRLGTDKPKTSPYQKSNQRLAEIIQIIKKTAEPRCKVIDSTKDLGLTQNNIQTTNDGLHFNAVNGQKWAQAAAKKINELEDSNPEQNKKGITNSSNKTSPTGLQ